MNKIKKIRLTRGIISKVIIFARATAEQMFWNLFFIGVSITLVAQPPPENFHDWFKTTLIACLGMTCCALHLSMNAFDNKMCILAVPLLSLAFITNLTWIIAVAISNCFKRK